ncbi:MAG: 1-deoxy-D-xylulose-5-phosphate reductoisomerase [Simkaniaceae bacterium]|nr:1-deoxy-D-xylulose-5-phosphate reductoisomerase [Simkaniaceae bacterium]
MNIAVLGSTGSVGENTLIVAAHLGFRVVALAARRNISRLLEQIRQFSPEIVAVYDLDQALILQTLVDIPVVSGDEGLEIVASWASAKTVVMALMGSVGIRPVLAALKLGKRVALANKETLVMAGEYVMQVAEKYGAEIIPVDSEHSAIFQCLEGSRSEEVKKIILTASGGPFREYSIEALQTVTREEALCHPTYVMGPKITIDSSTLMNKGLEVIEAFHLFRVPIDQIEVVIHPQSIVHSLVEYVDGSTLAQLSPPDMKLPIQYALTYPNRLVGIAPCLNFTKSSKLEFFPPDYQSFPCLGLAFHALRVGKSMPCFLNAANEEIVKRFLGGEFRWCEIGRKLERVMGQCAPYQMNNLEDHLAADEEARCVAREV